MDDLALTTSELWSILAPKQLRSVWPRERPTFSVVVPYFRGADYIQQAIESVLQQTLLPYEIVICDDGSPDDLEAALGSLRSQVRVVRKENGGVASAMNAAVRAASGDFVVQLDQDDVFLPRRLEAITAVVTTRPDIDVVATDAFLEYDGVTVARFNEAIPFHIDDQRAGIIRHCFFCWPAVRRSRLLSIGGFDESFSVMHDWDCFLRLVLDGATVALVDEPLYRWRLTPGSLSSNNVANIEGVIRMREKALESNTLDESERSRVRSLIASDRRRLARAEAKRALDEGRPEARRLMLDVALRRGSRLSNRVAAALAALSPSAARWYRRRSITGREADEAFARRMLMRRSS